MPNFGVMMIWRLERRGHDLGCSIFRQTFTGASSIKCVNFLLPLQPLLPFCLALVASLLVEVALHLRRRSRGIDCNSLWSFEMLLLATMACWSCSGSTTNSWFWVWRKNFIIIDAATSARLPWLLLHARAFLEATSSLPASIKSPAHRP